MCRKLKLFLRRNDIQVSDFARRLGVSRSHLYLIFSGKRLPSNKLQRLIMNETQGEIMPNDFVLGELNKT